MRYLITGGSGFIGSALCTHLLERGDEVTVLTRSAAPTAARLGPRVRVVERLADVGDVDAVVNLAGESLAAGRWTPTRKRALRHSRIDTTRRLVEWMAAQVKPPTVLISASAIGWYGPHDDEELDEGSAPGNDFAAQLCRDWEAEAIKAEALGIRVCRLRIGIVLAADGGALGKMLLPFRLGLGGPIGKGTQWMSWIARVDVVALIRWLAETPAAHGVFNATAPTPVRNKVFVKVLGDALHRPSIVPTPAFALQLILGEMADLLLTGQRVLPKRTLAQGFSFRYADLNAALSSVLGSSQ